MEALMGGLARLAEVWLWLVAMFVLLIYLDMGLRGRICGFLASFLPVAEDPDRLQADRKKAEDDALVERVMKQKSE